MMCTRIARYVCALALMVVVGAIFQPAWAVLPTPNQPILVVQSTASADPYQNFVPELLRAEGLNGYQTAQLGELTAAFLTNYDVVILPRLTLTAAQVTLFQTYVNAGGVLIGFRPDLQLASVFGVASLGTTLSEAWLKIDTTTPYGSALESQTMRFHGTADLYSLSGATALATLYSNAATPTASPAAAIYTLGLGKAILFSFDLSQSIVLMRQGNPAWAGYPNTTDDYQTLRPSQMFMNHLTGEFWNDLGDGALNDVPQADIQLRLFSNALTLANTAKRPLPRLWYFPDRERAMLLLTGDHHGQPPGPAVLEADTIQANGGKITYFLWYPFDTISNAQVNSWISAGHSIGIHFNDTAEVDGTGIGGSAASWAGMQSVLNTARTAFAAAYPTAPLPSTTRTHFLIWVSRNAAGQPDQTAQAKLFQAAGIELDTSFAAFPKRWGYMTGSGLPMKFLDTANGTVIPVYEQATQYEDDIQLDHFNYSLGWDLPTAQIHYQKTLSDSVTKYNTVVTMLFHPEWWSQYYQHVQTILDLANTQSIPMYSTHSWLQYWKAREAATISKPTFTANTLTFTVTGTQAGLTLLIPHASGNNVISAVSVNGNSQSVQVEAYQGVLYASIVLANGTSNVSATYSPSGHIRGQITPVAAAASTTIQVERIDEEATLFYLQVAANGTYDTGPLPSGTYSLSPGSVSYSFDPFFELVNLNSADVNNINFTGTPKAAGQTLFTAQTPVLINLDDNVNYELGTAFTSIGNGNLAAIRFWKDSAESGQHVGRIWSSTGQVLAEVTFENETASGWQQQDLTSLLPITANTTYVVTVNTGNGFYVATIQGLASQVSNGNLRSVVGTNGRLGPVGAFPTNSFANTNYFRDVVLIPGPVSLASVSLNPTSVAGGSPSTGTVTLTGAAPVGGTIVTLSSNHAAATVPPNATVAAGANTATFNVTTTAVATITTASISGTFGGTLSANLTVNPVAVSSVSMNPTSVLGGSPSTGTVTLGSPALAGGAVVILSDDSASSTTPPSVTVAAGATTATFEVTTTAVATVTNVTITATYNGSQTAGLTINPPALSAVSMDPTNVIGGSPSTGTVTLSGPAPAGGAAVVLSDDSLAATTPSSVLVAEGATTATFNVTTSAVIAVTTVTVTATYNGVQTGSLAIHAAAIAAMSLNPTSVTGGSSSTGTVTLNGPAPAGGAIVTLSNDNPIAPGVEGIASSNGLPNDGSIHWASLGAPFASVPSGTAVPVAGLPGLHLTFSTATGSAMQILTQCPGANCGWGGNFPPNATLLWTNGAYGAGDVWTGNGPLTVTLSSPQRGLGFQIMADEFGPFTATLCAYNATDTLLGCVPFTGNGTGGADGSAIFAGLYDDALEISKVTIDAGGALYPHDFAISSVVVANARRQMVPASVTVAPGATSANFTLTTNPVPTSIPVTVTGAYNGSDDTAELTVTP